jgi:hypothetical protein
MILLISYDTSRFKQVNGLFIFFNVGVFVITIFLFLLILFDNFRLFKNRETLLNIFLLFLVIGIFGLFVQTMIQILYDYKFTLEIQEKLSTFNFDRVCVKYKENQLYLVVFDKKVVSFDEKGELLFNSENSKFIIFENILKIFYNNELIFLTDGKNIVKFHKNRVASIETVENGKLEYFLVTHSLEFVSSNIVKYTDPEGVKRVLEIKCVF